jgi:hypothetical protein
MNRSDRQKVITLAVGGMRLRLGIDALPQAMVARLVCDYGPFLTGDGCCEEHGAAPAMQVMPAAESGRDLAVELVVEEGPRFFEPAPEQSWRIDTQQAGGQLSYTSYDEQGWIDYKTARGYLLLRPQAQPENFLRLAFSRLALAHDGLLLHASGLIFDGRGYVFFGHSGAGKSTVAGLAPPGCTLLSDDLVLLRLHGAAPGRAWLHGVPFRGEALPAPRPNAAALLAGLYALRQAPSHALARLPAPTAAAHLLACVPFLAGDAAAGRQALAVCTRMAQAMPVHTLAFARNPGFWKLLTGEEGPP